MSQTFRNNPLTSMQVGAIAEKAKGGLPSAPKLQKTGGKKVATATKAPKMGGKLASPVKSQWEKVSNQMLSGPGVASNF